MILIHCYHLVSNSRVSINLKITNKLRMKKSLVKFCGFVKSVTKMRAGCLRMTKVAIFVA